MTTAMPRRRSLLLGAALAGAAGTGCSRTRPVATSEDIPRDPLADVDPDQWDGSTAADLLALPITGERGSFPGWEAADEEPADLEATREELVRILETAYLTPEETARLEDDEARERMLDVVPQHWRDQLVENWVDQGSRHFYSFALAEPFRTVGEPLVRAEWTYGDVEEHGASHPTLLLGGEIAWSVVEPDRHDVGSVAYRFGFQTILSSAGGLVESQFRITVHGIELCETEEDGITVPAIRQDDEGHRTAQESTRTFVLTAPRLTYEQLDDQESEIFEGRETTNVSCP